MNDRHYQWALDQLHARYPDASDPVRKTVTAVMDTWIRTDSQAFDPTAAHREEALDVFCSLARGQALPLAQSDTAETPKTVWAPLRQYPRVSTRVRVIPTFVGNLDGVSWPIAGQIGTLLGARRGTATVEVLHPEMNDTTRISVPAEYLEVDVTHLQGRNADEVL